MKKNNVLKLYSIMDNNKEVLTQSLNLLLGVKGKAEDLLLKYCEENKNYIYEENLSDIVELSISIGEIKNEYYRKEIAENVSKLLKNPIIRELCLTRDISDKICDFLEFSYWNYFDIEDSDEICFYYSYVIDKFTSFFEKIKNIEIDHEFDLIFEAQTEMLLDLNNTQCNDYKENQMKLKRISAFYNIISDEIIYTLDEYKFFVVLEACKTCTNVDELKRLKYVARFNKHLNDREFSQVIDACISDFTPLSIDNIYNEINYHVRSVKMSDGSETLVRPMPNNIEKVDGALQKVLKPTKNDLIFNKK